MKTRAEIIEDLKRDKYDLAGVIDAVIEANGFIGVGLISLAEQVEQYIRTHRGGAVLRTESNKAQAVKRADLFRHARTTVRCNDKDPRSQFHCTRKYGHGGPVHICGRNSNVAAAWPADLYLRQYLAAGQVFSYAEMAEANKDDEGTMEFILRARIGELYPEGDTCYRVDDVRQD